MEVTRATPKHLGYVYDAMCRNEQWFDNPSEEYCRGAIERRIAAWSLDYNYRFRVCTDNDEPLGFYVAQFNVFDHMSGGARVFVEEFQSDSVRASWKLWLDLKSSVRLGNPEGGFTSLPIFANVHHDNINMRCILDRLGFKEERIQVVYHDKE